MTDFFYDSFHMIVFFLLPGVFLGVLYDIFRMVRIARKDSKEKHLIEKLHMHFCPSKPFIQNTKNKHDTILLFLEDFIFCTLAAITEIILFFHMNQGVIRIYAILISFVGFLWYHHTFGRLTIFIANRLIKFIRILTFYISVILLTPPIAIYKVFYKAKQHKKVKEK